LLVSVPCSFCPLSTSPSSSSKLRGLPSCTRAAQGEVSQGSPPSGAAS
jgi:hypothetical protein